MLPSENGLRYLSLQASTPSELPGLWWKQTLTPTRKPGSVWRTDSPQTEAAAVVWIGGGCGGLVVCEPSPSSSACLVRRPIV